MKQFWKDAGIAFTMGLIVPSVLLGAVVSLTRMKSSVPKITDPIFVSETEDWNVIMTPQKTISVLQEDGEVVRMPLNDYLTSVVLAEIPVTFEEEAIKAQSVVARTYTIRAAEGTSKHGNAAVCTKSSCCQAYVREDEYLQQGGKDESVRYVRQIVESTDGQVLTYDGNLIEATYFSCSGGTTEDAVAVWGTDVPYLQSVVSPGEESAAYYTDTAVFTKEDVESRLGLKLNGEPEHWFSEVVYTDGGGVATIMIGGQSFSGTQLRKLFDLRSTAFDVAADEELITFHTRGYGHRVGMSQYGANAMALTGSTYPEILAHYYQGTELIYSAD